MKTSLLNRFGLLSLFAIFSLILCTPKQLPAQNSLERALQILAKDPDLQNASIGFYAIDIDKNEVLAQYNPDLSLITASTMKAITTSTALAILGADYKFKTILEYDGFIKDGVLNGNLYLTGSGDPSLGSPYMPDIPSLEQIKAEFVQAVKKAGIHRINGSVIGDGSYFDLATAIPTWQWMDTGNHYGAGVSGLNLHDNLYYLSFRQSNQIGEQPKIVEVFPSVPNFTFQNEVTTAAKGTGDNVYIYASPYSVEAFIRGSIPAGNGIFKIKGAVVDPELFAANWLHQALRSENISVNNEPSSQKVYKVKTARTTIHTHYSPSLSLLVKHINELSRNMYCEALIKAIGKKLKNEGSTEAGVAAVLEFWKGRGIDTKGFFMEDGSGLSARNGVTAKAMAQIMRKVYIDKVSFGNFYDLLAVGGETGTFQSMGRNTALHNNLHGKGGSMNRIRSYTGYITSRSKRNIAFSIIVNNYNCSGYAIRKKLELLLLSIAESQD